VAICSTCSKNSRCSSGLLQILHLAPVLYILLALPCSLMNSTHVPFLQARALLQAAQIQQQHLQHISNNLPQHLPNLLDQSMQAAAPSNAIAAFQSSNSSATLGVRCPGSAPVPPGIAIAKDDSRGEAPYCCSRSHTCQRLM